MPSPLKNFFDLRFLHDVTYINPESVVFDEFFAVHGNFVHGHVDICSDIILVFMLACAHIECFRLDRFRVFHSYQPFVFVGFFVFVLQSYGFGLSVGVMHCCGCFAETERVAFRERKIFNVQIYKIYARDKVFHGKEDSPCIRFGIFPINRNDFVFALRLFEFVKNFFREFLFEVQVLFVGRDVIQNNIFVRARHGYVLLAVFVQNETQLYGGDILFVLLPFAFRFFRPYVIESGRGLRKIFVVQRNAFDGGFFEYRIIERFNPRE